MRPTHPETGTETGDRDADTHDWDADGRDTADNC